MEIKSLLSFNLHPCPARLLQRLCKRLVMKKLHTIILFLLLRSCFLFAQNVKSENIIIVTLDGYRWQEVFHGPDSAILFNEKYVKDKTTYRKFWDHDMEKRRQNLMPFFWSVINKKGQLYGNRDYNNLVNCTNPYWMSYPGYSEMLVGFVDKRIHSNRKIENPNSTVLEFIHKQPGFEKKVAVFSTWDAIPYIIRSSASKIHANGGREKAAADSLTINELFLNELIERTPNPYGERFDAFTFHYAFEYLKRKLPRTMFISFDETDEHAHGGRYDEYLKSAHRTDQMIEELWTWLQLQEQYKDKTTLIIATDHGRGKGAKRSWKKHNRLAPGSNQMWFAVIGPDTPPMGEIKVAGKYYQKQIAKTAAAFLGLDYTNVQPVGSVIKEVIPTYDLAVQYGATK
jgi:hypothetical protein